MRAADLNFPYPVLGDVNTMTGPLPEISYTPAIPPKEMISIPYRWTFEVDLKNEDILKLIKEGKAKYMCEVSCSATLLRKCLFFSEPKFTIELGRKEINKRVEFSLCVVAVEHLPNYDNSAATEDYREFAPFDLDVGSPLAVLKSYCWDADLCYEDLTSLRSILQILENTVNPAEDYVSVNLDHEYIQILLPPQQYKPFIEKSQNPAFFAIMTSSLVMYALQSALNAMTLQMEHRWERVLDRYIRQDNKFEGLSWENKGDVPAIAARMLGNPFKSLSEALGKLVVREETPQDSDDEVDDQE